MEKKLFPAGCITLDGRMDEAVWADVPEHTGFQQLGFKGGRLVGDQTFFKILPCEDRIYVGIKCQQSNMDKVRSFPPARIYATNGLELFLSPSNDPYDVYHFMLTFDRQKKTYHWSEFGHWGELGTDAHGEFTPVWDYAVYDGGDYWSAEVELPLTTFFLTSQKTWSDTWLVNMARNNYVSAAEDANNSWCPLEDAFLEPKKFPSMGGFPIRRACDAVRIAGAEVSIDSCTDGIYYGTLTVQSVNPEADTFAFASNCCDPITIKLEEGKNTFTVPCRFTELGLNNVSLELKRVGDGLVFKRFYDVRVSYDPIKLHFVAPEYRCNFYPGQDYTKVTGFAEVDKPVTLHLEGPGITTQDIVLEKSGEFEFETPDFEVGEAFLTATVDDWQISRKIRRLAPTARTMTWISGGNLIVNGEPMIRREVYAPYYHASVRGADKYRNDNLHETRNIRHVEGIQVDGYPGAGAVGNETTMDVMPSDAIKERIDRYIEAHKNEDYGYYYLSDEPEFRGYSLVYLKNVYEYIADKDPYHAVALCSNSPGKYVDCADWIETDPYISPRITPAGERFYLQTLDAVSKHVDQVAQLNRADKIIGIIPQCYGGWPGWAGKVSENISDYPTFDEFICNSWVGLNHGAKSVWPYAGHDLHDRAQMYEGCRYIFASVEAVEDILMHGKRTILFHNEKLEVVMWVKGDEKMFTVTNLLPSAQTVTVDGIDGTWYNFRHTDMITGNTFALKPFEVVIGTSSLRGADLPTYHEVAAFIDNWEANRKQTKNLLYGLKEYIDFSFTSSLASRAHPAEHKLMDGVLDNYAWSQGGSGDKFVQLTFITKKFNIGKLVVHGWNLDNMEFKVAYGDELSVPEIAETICDEFSTTIVLAKPITPDALRFEFNDKSGKTVQLFEIEAF